MNILTQRGDDLGEMQHGPILESITAVLSKHGAFLHDNQGRLCVDADGIARAVVAHRRWNDREILKRPAWGNASVCTVNMEPAALDAMRSAIQKIAAILANQLADQARPYGATASELARRYMGPLDAIPPFGRMDTRLYQAELRRQAAARRRRLTFRAPVAAGQAPLMRWHKLTITVQVPRDMARQLATAVERYLQQHWKTLSHDDQEELAAILEEQATAHDSDLTQLVRGLQTETIGQLKKEAQLCYLAFLARQLEERDPAHRPLREMIRRLRALQAWAHDPDKADADYDITIAGETHNLRILFAQADAFNALPVVPNIDGYVGETTSWEPNEQQHVFGTKLKLNGPVTRFDNLSSFAYHLDVLRGQRPMRADRLARLAVLYFVMFTQYNNATFDPIEDLETDILPRLRNAAPGTDAAARTVLRDIAAQCAPAELEPLVRGLRTLLRRVTAAEPGAWDVQIHVGAGLVDANRQRVLREGRVFREVLAPDKKAYLAYIGVGDPHSSADSLFKLNAQIRYEDVQCYDGDGAVESCTMTYAVADYTVLPVFLTVGRVTPASAATPPAPGVVISCSIDGLVKAIAGQKPGGMC